jgi:hypothetical protein
VVGFLVSVGLGESGDLVLGETVGEEVGAGVLVTVCVGDAEVTCSVGSSEELKIEANQIIAINPPMVERDPRFSLTFINLREAKTAS